ncbi:MAG TPA: hypothetical protein VIG33_15770 [Pseudobdellovibrionaceae bacterium]|jgi:hypothetical protein
MKSLGSFILILFGLSVITHAEYRMFTLKITNKNTQDYRLVDSTLDPVQYPYYYPVQKDEVVQYTDTWRCYGRTGGGLPPCPNLKSNPATNPAPVANP